MNTLSIIAVLLLVFSAHFTDSSHLLNPRTSSGRYLSIQDRVLHSCLGHFMCEVFPYYSSIGLNCLDINNVCDGTPQCRDGVDELSDMCSTFRRASEGMNETSSRTRRIIRIIRTEAGNDSAVDFNVPTIETNTRESVQINTIRPPDQAHILGSNRMDVIASTPSSLLNERAANPPVNQLSGNDLNMNMVAASDVAREQRSMDSLFNFPSFFGDRRTPDSFYDQMSRMMQDFNPLTNNFGMPYQNMQSSRTQRPKVVEYYKTQKGQSDRQRDTNFKSIQPREERGLNFGPYKNRRNDGANTGFFNPELASQFVNRHMSIPGSSYVDNPVTTPSPQIPDGFVYQPGKEPYLAEEQQFLEKQLYLPNELQEANQPQTTNDVASKTGNDGLSVQERLTNQMKIGKLRQEQLLRQKFFGLSTTVATTDSNIERYGVMGPFDGGVPSVPGEVKGLNTMEGQEAQNALHNVEALH